MNGARARLALAPWTTVCLVTLAILAGPGRAEEPPAPPPRLDEFGEPEDPEELRERLTEREDENRMERPSIIDVLGRPLTVSGEYEIALDWASKTELGEDTGDSEELLLEQELEAEVFYPLGSDVFLFAQGLFGMERSLHAPEGTSQVESYFAERGEMWLYVRNLGGRPCHLDVGSLDFEEDRTWWWDADLDAVRVEYEGDGFDVALALAREVTARRTDLGFIEPEHERVTRWLGEASWEWSEDHALELFAIGQGDHSPREKVGSSLDGEREDESDASLTWIGPRAVGAWSSPARGILGYWLDGAIVWGREILTIYEESDGSSVVEDRTRQKVRGWALDTGFTWILPRALDPSFTLAFARGSGDSSPERGPDRSFRQTGLESNESAFGGVQRFEYYGVLLEPELSNLQVLTLGVGVSLLDSSSLNLVFHDYRQLEATTSLRDARVELELSGADEHVGSELDLVLALEEWDRFELELIGSMFHAGSAVVAKHDDWSYGGFFALRVAF